MGILCAVGDKRELGGGGAESSGIKSCTFVENSHIISYDHQINGHVGDCVTATLPGDKTAWTCARPI